MIKVEFKGFDKVLAHMTEVQKQVRYATSRALNNVAFATNAEIKREMQAKFKGGATSYTLQAFKVIKATKETLTATVALRFDSPGKARSYDKTLAHLFTGGTRRWKNMEGAFRRIGVLYAGDMMVVPRNASWANPLDSFGNPKPSFITQLISYFGAFGEQGYRANMTDKRKGRIAKRGTTAAGYKTINGVVYFISRGKGMWYGRPQHLAAGIWAKRGIHGSDVAPVFLFVRKGMWGKVIDLEQLGGAVVTRSWQTEFDKEFSAAMRSAK